MHVSSGNYCNRLSQHLGYSWHFMEAEAVSKWRRGKSTGLSLCDMCALPVAFLYGPPLPPIILSNVRSIKNKTDELMYLIKTKTEYSKTSVYTPREFSCVVFFGVYVPPDATATTVNNRERSRTIENDREGPWMTTNDREPSWTGSRSRCQFRERHVCLLASFLVYSLIFCLFLVASVFHCCFVQIWCVPS